MNEFSTLWLTCMSDRTIAIAALEIEDVAARAQYVMQACQGDTRRQQVVLQLMHQLASEQPLQTSPLSIDGASEAVAAADLHSADAATTMQKLQSCLKPPQEPGCCGSLGHYDIECYLGHGAFGIVVRAFDTKLHRTVAIKVLHPELAATSPPRRRFLREARTAAALQHENVVRILAVEEDPLPFLVMEYIEGRSLQQVLDSQGPLSPHDVLIYAEQIAAGLAAAHNASLIHRDIKPANILLARAPSTALWISDFGLARTVDDASISASGQVAGTPLFMSPEQARGERLDARTDLFSLGSVIYTMVTGHPPFRARSIIAVLRRVCEDAHRPPQEVIPETPNWLCGLIDGLLQKDRDTRLQTSTEVFQRLRRFRQELEVSGHVSSSDLQMPVPSNIRHGTVEQRKPARSTLWPWLTAASLLLAILAVLLRPAPDGVPSPRITQQDTTVVTSQQVAESLTLKALQNALLKPPGRTIVWPPDTPAFAIAPYDSLQARQFQRAWADWLGIPVEITNEIGMAFRLVPPGEFLMGLTESELQSMELPTTLDAAPRRVRLTRPFYLAVTELTQLQHQQIMGSTQSHFTSGTDAQQRPAEQISFNDATALLDRLNSKFRLSPKQVATGQYRLPSEAEWEFACRAGTTTAWSTGNDVKRLAEVAWFENNSAAATHPVKQTPANPFGFYDMHGNVCEWCEDWYQPWPARNTGESDIVQSDPLATEASVMLYPDGVVRSGHRVYRGGDWFHPAFHCSSGFRQFNVPDYNIPHNGGVRVALDLDLQSLRRVPAAAAAGLHQHQ